MIDYEALLTKILKESIQKNDLSNVADYHLDYFIKFVKQVILARGTVDISSLDILHEQREDNKSYYSLGILDKSGRNASLNFSMVKIDRNFSDGMPDDSGLLFEYEDAEIGSFKASYNIVRNSFSGEIIKSDVNSGTVLTKFGEEDTGFVSSSYYTPEEYELIEKGYNMVVRPEILTSSNGDSLVGKVIGYAIAGQEQFVKDRLTSKIR